MKKHVFKGGEKFNRLTLIREVDRKNKDKRRFLFRCDCGRFKELNLITVTTSKIRTCGCIDFNYNALHKGDSSKSWKGGIYIDGGYRLIYKPEHPTSKSNGYIREHRYIMEIFLGRSLLSNENIHHINGDKLDNRIENLELWNTSQPCGQRIEDKVKWAKEILELYGK